MVRCKFIVQSLTEHSYSKTAKTVKLMAHYDQTIPEDQRFAQATPTGSMEMLVDNPAALNQLKLGEFYYIDLTPVPKQEPVAQ